MKKQAGIFALGTAFGIGLGALLFSKEEIRQEPARQAPPTTFLDEVTITHRGQDPQGRVDSLEIHLTPQQQQYLRVMQPAYAEITTAEDRFPIAGDASTIRRSYPQPFNVDGKHLRIYGVNPNTRRWTLLTDIELRR